MHSLLVTLSVAIYQLRLQRGYNVQRIHFTCLYCNYRNYNAQRIERDMAVNDDTDEDLKYYED